MTGWADAARAAEERHDCDEAISIVGAAAECFSQDYNRHNAHLWHMHLLAQAGRMDELARLAGSDVHARRQLDRTLREAGEADELRRRADDGDRYALLQLKRLREPRAR
jgi:hypothetical protein